MVVGPYTSFDLGEGRSADLYLLRYGEDGRLLSTKTEKMLRESVAEASDVFVISHGWNNTFAAAESTYTRFIEGYMAQRARFGLPRPADYRPVLVGVIWPSTSFVLPWEDGPRILADSAAEAGRTEEMLRLVSSALPEEPAARLVELVDGKTALTEAEATEAAEAMLAGLDGDDPDDGAVPPTADELLAAWAALEGGTSAQPDPDDFGEFVEDTGQDPEAAGFLSKLDPRNLLRMGTVWLMKDRAGKVGARGVGPLVGHVLGLGGKRLHLVGHSFGARVVLSSMAVQPDGPTARSMLLLQPAINRWCFAADVAGKGRRGGYEPVLRRVALPILSTYSKRDVPLRQTFHLAVRGSSLGEPDIAAVGDTDRFGALGGYGPAGLGELADHQSALEAGTERYRFTAGKKIIAVNGGVDVGGQPAINGHSDVNNPTTWWALHCLTGAP